MNKFHEFHNCDNYICKLLNPSLERLLKYNDLKDRVTEAEEYFFNNLDDINKFKGNYPVDLIGWCNIHHIWQLLNEEFIKELAKEIKEMDAKIILEVGSGKGLIGKYLCKELIKDLNKDFILTDDYSWWKNDLLDEETIIRMDYKTAIKTYKPDLIIASWIPYNRWWTGDFREIDSVEGYILIGEHPGGCTGSEMDWNTQWTKFELDNVERFGICRTDHGFKYGSPIFHTNVTYFKKP